MSIDYYQQHAHAFFNNTLTVDMTPLYKRFLPHVPAGGHIVDAGCGSGRDSRYFADLGFKVTAFDVSSALVTLARQHSQLPVQLCSFSDFTTLEPVDGIWACASLLHLPYNQLAPTLNHLAQLLVPAGIFYCSFKYGQGAIQKDGRHFTNLDEQQLAELIKPLPLTLIEHWQTGDLREGREQERWLNALLIKDPA